MPWKGKRLDSLRRAAEEASSALREVAHVLDQLAESTPARQADRKRLLVLTGDRLTSAAVLLTAEINASNPSTARKAAEIAAAGLVYVTALVVPGAAEGVTASLAAKVLASQQTATICVETVVAHAKSLEESLAAEVAADIEEIRVGLVAFRSLVHAPEGDQVLADYGINAGPDLGLPNARQRVVHMSIALDNLWRLANLDDLSDQPWTERDRLAGDLEPARIGKRASEQGIHA